MADNKNDISFEDALAKLNDIATKLKAKDISLEETIKYFEEGNECYKLCKDILDNAKQKIEVYQGE